MKGHVVLSLDQMAGNPCKVPENVLCPAVIVSPDTDTYFGGMKVISRNQALWPARAWFKKFSCELELSIKSYPYRTNVEDIMNF